MAGLCIRSYCFLCFFFQAEDGIRDLVRSRGLGDVYKRQRVDRPHRGLDGEGDEEADEHPAQCLRGGIKVAGEVLDEEAV